MEDINDYISSEEETPKSITYSILVMGHNMSGKSTLINTYCKVKDSEARNIDLKMKIIKIGDKDSIKLKIWKLRAGVDNSMDAYFKDADGAIILIDIMKDNKESITVDDTLTFKSTRDYWIKKLTETYTYYNPNKPLIPYTLACNMKSTDKSFYLNYLTKPKYTKLNCDNLIHTEALFSVLINQINIMRNNISYLNENDDNSSSEMPYDGIF